MQFYVSLPSFRRNGDVPCSNANGASGMMGMFLAGAGGGGNFELTFVKLKLREEEGKREGGGWYLNAG